MSSIGTFRAKGRRYIVRVVRDPDEDVLHYRTRDE